MLEVKFAKPLNGCVLGILNLCTFGLYGMLFRSSQRGQIARMDGQGFQTLGGKRYRWSDIRRVERTKHTVLGAEAYTSIHVYLDRGFVTLPTGAATNGAEVMAFFSRYSAGR